MTSRYVPLMVWVEPEMKDALKRVRERDGVNVSEQARRALAAWLRDREAPTCRVREVR